jgi:hypothetical protein
MPEDEAILLVGGPLDGRKMMLPAGQAAWPIQHPDTTATILLYHRDSDNPGRAIYSGPVVGNESGA